MKDEIYEVKHRYCWAFDAGDLPALLALFTDDAVCELGAFGTWRGKAAIEAGYREQMVYSKVPGGRLHTVSNPVVEVDGDRATGRWYLIDYDIEPDTTQPIKLFATYDDGYRREGGRWLIERTSLTVQRAFTANITGR